MYEELVTKLRNESECDEYEDWVSSMLSQAADAIEELMRRCEQFQYMPLPAWIPVEERLPTESGKYLVRYIKDIDIDDGIHDDEIKIMRYTVNAGWRFPVICNPDVRKLLTMEQVTHWMSLPEPPKDG